MGKLKNILFMDVDNPNEKADGPIALRISAIVMMIYLAVISVLLVMGHRVLWMVGNLLFVLIYGYLIGMTYRNHTRIALIWYNVVTVVAVCFNVGLIGWNIGIQHFLFVLVLMDLIFTCRNRWNQCAVVLFLCVIRLALYFYCRMYATTIQLQIFYDIFLQVFTTVAVFFMLYLNGMMLARDSQIIERKLMKYNKELQRAANTDMLTKLWNRLFLMQYMEKKVASPDIFLSIAIGDIDFFKKVNDTYGHECGDEVLRTLAAVFKKEMEGHGVVARWGGEEFIFVFEGVNGDEAMVLLDHLQRVVRDTVINYEGLQLKVTMTFGLVEYNTKLRLDENINIADERLYIGKEKGRDRIIY